MKTVNRYFSDDQLARGFEDCQELAYVQHCEGLTSAREYQHRLKVLRRHFGISAPEVSKGDHCKVFHFSRTELDILNQKIGSIQRQIADKVNGVIEDHSYDTRKGKVSVSVGKVSVGIMQYCTKDGEVDDKASQVDARFDIVVKYTKRGYVRA